MAGIQLTKEDVERGTEFLLQYLRDAGYEGSLEDGTAIYDVMVKGFALLYTLFQQQGDKAIGYQSLAKAQEFKELLGDEYDQAVDAILSNWFVARKEGLKTTGTVRLWFVSPTDFLRLVPGEKTFTYDDQFFEVASEYVFSSSDFEQVSNTPQSGDEYYVDVDVISMERAGILISDGEALSAYINNVYFIRAEAYGDFITGKGQETSEEFIERTQNAITTRELISDNAIKTVLQEEFNGVENVYVAGYGDPEQLRDIVIFSDMTIHVGNKADIYIGSSYRRASVLCTVGTGGVIDLAQELGGNAPLAHVVSVATVDVDGVETPVTFSMTVSEESWLTVGADCQVQLDIGLEGLQAKVTYLETPALPSVDDFVRSPLQRVSCYDPFIKSMHPIILSMTLGVTSTDGNLEDLKPLVTSAVQEFVLNIRHQTPYTESTLIEYLHSQISTLESVSVPINASFSLFNEGDSTFVNGQCGSSMLLPPVAGLTVQASDSTIQFYTDSNFISFS